MAANISQKVYLPKPDNFGIKGNSSSLFDRNPESILKRQEKAKLLRGLRRSFANASRRIYSSTLYNEEDASAIPRESKILHELNTHRDKTPKARIGRVACFSSRKRNLTFTVDQKKALSNLNFEQECKRSLNFNKQENSENNFKYNSRKSDYKKNFKQCLPPVDLTNTKVEGSMLRVEHDRNGDISKQNNSKKYFKPGFDDSTISLKKLPKSNDSSEGDNICDKKFHSQLPILKLSAATTSASSLISSKYNKVTSINKFPHARRSMSALSFLHRNTDSSSAVRDKPFQKHSFSENEVDVFSGTELKTSYGAKLTQFVMPSTISIKVTKPSLSLDEEADIFAMDCDSSHIKIIEKIDSSSEKFLPISKLQNENIKSIETVINSASTKNNVSAVSPTKLEPITIPSSLSAEDHIFLNHIKQDDAGNCTGLPVVNAQAPTLSLDLSVESIKEILMQISQGRKQINVAMDEICDYVQTKAKAVIQGYESSIEPLERLLKLNLANDDEITKVNKTSCAAPAAVENIAPHYEASMKITDFSFLGTPMPTKKKRLARSLSHPQALIESQSVKNGKKHPLMQKLNTSDDKNSSYSAEDLSPFTNLVGDFERASLAPMTPATRHNFLNLKESLNQQLDLLFD